MSPYLGFESLRPALDLAAADRRGVFVLALTSNPEGRTVQHARLRDASVAGMVAAAAAENAAAARARRARQRRPGRRRHRRRRRPGARARPRRRRGPLLAPGVGAQGGTSEDLRRVFGDALPNVLPASSREVLAPVPTSAALRDRAVQTSDVAGGAPALSLDGPARASGQAGRPGAGTSTRNPAARLLESDRPASDSELP